MRWFILVAMTTVLLACGTTAHQDDELRRYLLDDLGLPEAQFPRAIFVITEEGCPTCERAFVDLLRPKLSVPRCLFLVRAVGESINLNGFLEETDQIRFEDGSFKELGILKGSGLVILDGNHVDTIIPLRTSEIVQQFAFMTILLDSLHSQSAAPQP